MAHRRKGKALRRRYGHARVARSATLKKKADRQEAQAGKVAARAAVVEHKIGLVHQKGIGAEEKLRHQFAALKEKANDLRNEASANRALAERLIANSRFTRL